VFNKPIWGSLTSFKSKPINANHERTNILEVVFQGAAGEEFATGILSALFQMVDERGTGTKIVVPIPLKDGSPVELTMSVVVDEDDDAVDVLNVKIATVSQVVLSGSDSGPPEFKVTVEFCWEEPQILFVARHHRKHMTFELMKAQQELHLEGGDETAV
jgi:hypothetical protein